MDYTLVKKPAAEIGLDETAVNDSVKKIVADLKIFGSVSGSFSLVPLLLPTDPEYIAVSLSSP
jgi:hypothetical protein